MALTSLANVKQWLEITTSTNDALLTRIIDSCSSYIESWLNRKILQASYTENYNGSGSSALTLTNYPIISLQSVSIGGVAQAIVSQSDFTTSGVKFSGRRLIGQNIKFSKGAGNIIISYTAGYAAVPSDIEQACIELVALRYKNGRGERLGVSSKALASESVSFFSGDMSDSTRNLLLQWRNVAR
jgi:uncharacterized phiE125 gp8 family phage protein